MSYIYALHSFINYNMHWVIMSSSNHDETSHSACDTMIMDWQIIQHLKSLSDPSDHVWCPSQSLIILFMGQIARIVLRTVYTYRVRLRQIYIV